MNDDRRSCATTGSEPWKWKRAVALTVLLSAAALPLLSPTGRLVAQTSEGSVSAILASIGDLSGVLGATLFSVSLVLMLRVGWLSEAFGGLDRLYRLHHVIGSFAYFAVLTHVAALPASRWAVSPSAAADWFSPLERPSAILSGWIALLTLMAALFAAYFYRGRYSLWKGLHAITAVAYGFAFHHVEAFAPGGVLVAYFGVGAAALIYRLLIEKTLAPHYDYEVESVEHLDPSTVRVTLAPSGKKMVFEAGQFLFVAFFEGTDFHGCGEYHPFTVASAPGEGKLALVVKALGDCTLRIQKMTPGVRARVQGPFGAFFHGDNFRRPQVWVAGGVGITPFLSMARALSGPDVAVDLYYVVRRPSQWVVSPDLEDIAARNTGLRLFPLCVERDQEVTLKVMEEHSAPLQDKAFYICGPPPMVKALIRGLAKRGVPESRIHSERFDFL